MAHEAHESEPPTAQPGRHRLLPIAGIVLVATTVLAHFVGGAAVVYVGLDGVLASLGAGDGRPGGVVLAVGLAVIGALALGHLLVVHGARGAAVGMTAKGGERTGITSGKVLHRARSHDAHAALLFLMAGRLRALRDATMALARIAPGDAVLDVGCGTGELTALASARVGPAGRTSGIDASPEMVAEAGRKASQAGLAVDYRVAAVEALPYPDAAFDVVLSSLMTHHLPDDLKDQALAEIRRVLKPGGHLLVVDFRRPTTLRDRLALPVLLHPQWRSLPSGVQDLPPRLTAAGFVSVEAGETGYGPVGYVRAQTAPRTSTD